MKVSKLKPAVFLSVLVLIFATTSAGISQAQSRNVCSQVQVTCGPLYIAYLGQNLSLKLFVCEFFDCQTGNWHIRTIDDSGYFQFRSDILVGLDNFPLIAYVVFDDGGGNATSTSKIVVAHCGDRLCLPNLITKNEVVVQNYESIGSLSLDINTFGLPTISYHDNLLEDLKVVLCTSRDCSSHNSPVVVDSAGDVGNGNKLISWETRDLMPIIAYLDSDELKFVHCLSSDCGTFDVLRVIDSPGNTSSISIALNPQTLEPVLVYDDTFNKTVKFVHCRGFNCSSNYPSVILDSYIDSATYPSITFGVDNNPMISYGLPNGELKVIHCTNPYCTTFDPPKILDSKGARNSITIAKDNMPVVSYFYPPTADLKFIHCTRIDCSNYSPITLDSQGNTGNYNSIAGGL